MPSGYILFFLRLLKKYTFVIHSVKPTSEEGEDEERPLETNQMADRLLQARDINVMATKIMNPAIPFNMYTCVFMYIFNI